MQQDLVDSIVRFIEPFRGEGKPADYIPALAAVDPNQFGIAIADGWGNVWTAGDADVPFSIQSISKVFTLNMALTKCGPALWDKVGREPSGSAFNSIIQLEHENGKPRNPLINAGAIAVTDQLVGDRDPKVVIDELVDFLRTNAKDDSVSIDEQVAISESETGNRNRALAWFMKTYGILDNQVETALYAYFRQCSIAMSCRQLARAGLYLAFDGRDPTSGAQVTPWHRARRINSVMMLCGHYDNSGEFAFRVGLPGKSGVGGGILAIAPGHASICVWSPGLNASGTSAVGARALEELVMKTGWSVFF